MLSTDLLFNNARSISISATKVVIISFCAVFLMAVTALAHSNGYQDQVIKKFPDFEILTRSEFAKFINNIVETNPALIAGQFNDDDLEDFAAIIINRSKQLGQHGEDLYHLGKYIVCHGAGKGQYRCQVLREVQIFLPYEGYLYRKVPGKIKCSINQKLNKTETALQKDAIGWVLVDRGSGLYIYQTDGTYSECLHEWD